MKSDKETPCKVAVRVLFEKEQDIEPLLTNTQQHQMTLIYTLVCAIIIQCIILCKTQCHQSIPFTLEAYMEC